MDPTPKWMAPYNKGQRPDWLTAANSYYKQKGDMAAQAAGVVMMIPTPPKTKKSRKSTRSPLMNRIRSHPPPPPKYIGEWKGPLTPAPNIEYNKKQKEFVFKSKSNRKSKRKSNRKSVKRKSNRKSNRKSVKRSRKPRRQ